MVRIACVKYLNTAPLIEGLDALRGVSLVRAAPARLAGMLQSGEADIALASIVDAPRAGLAILHAGMIGCDGPTLTVRLFSRVPFERITRLRADIESHTSVVLARLILGRVFGSRPGVIPFDAERESSADADDALLLIGDKVVTSAPPSERFPHQLDLGKAWRDWTGLPFVYAAWMAKSERADDPDIVLASALLDRQRRRNAMRLGWLARRHAPLHGWGEELADRYLRDYLRFDLDERSRAGAARFLSEVSSLDPVPVVTPPATASAR